MKSHDTPSQRENIPGSRFFSDLVFIADRRLGKEEVDDWCRASLIAGREAVSEIISSDERALQQWDRGSIPKALGLLEVWASSIQFLHFTAEKHRTQLLSGIAGTFELLFGTDGQKITKELSNFALALDDRPDEAVNLTLASVALPPNLPRTSR